MLDRSNGEVGSWWKDKVQKPFDVGPKGFTAADGKARAQIKSHLY
jgi:hypothetical protein